MKYIVKDSKEFKADKIVEYFTDPNRIDVTDLNFASAIKLDKMIAIYVSQEDSLNKYYQMKEIFKSSRDFAREYGYLKEFSYDSKVNYLYEYVYQIANYFTTMEMGISKESEKELLLYEKESYFEDYPYAKYYVKEFIDYKESPYLKDFLVEKGIYEQDFSRFLSILISFDDELYDQYVEKEKENKTSRQLDVIRKLENIRSGVITGYTKEGKEFDQIEYYSNLPFTDKDTAKAVLEDFELKKLATLDQRLRTLIENLCSEDVSKIMGYIYKNNLIFAKSSKISEEEIKKNNYIINDKALDEKGKEEVIKYMKEKNIPFITQAFNAVKNKYLNDKLQTVEEKSLNKVANK